MQEQQLNAVKTDHDLQVELEEWQRNLGASRVLAPGWERAAEGALMNKLMRPYLDALTANWIQGKTRPSKQSHVWSVIGTEEALHQAGIEAFCYLLSMAGETCVGNGLARMIGRRAEFVLWLGHPDWGKSKHLQGLRLAGGSDLGMELMTKRLRDKNFRRAASYVPLKPIQRCALGWIFITTIESSTRLIEVFIGTEMGGKRKKKIRASDLLWDYFKNYKEIVKWLRPVKLPMMVPPKPWTGHHQGGYLTIETQFSSVEWEHWPIMHRHSMPCVLGSTNQLQAQAYRIDEAMQEFVAAVWESGHAIGRMPSKYRMPAPKDHVFRDQGLGPSAFWKAQWRYKADRRLDGKRSQVISCFSTIEKLKKTDRIFFVHKQCNRGRIHTLGGQLHPQSGDHFRAMLQFEETSQIKGHEEQFAWSIGEAYGIRRDREARMNFLFEERDLISQAGNDPMDKLEFIDQAKEPFRFAQLCLDWNDYMLDDKAKSGTIHWLDQTCSGWGHVACLTMDGELAQYTNVTGKNPADLYTAIGLLVMSYVERKIRDPELSDRQGKCLTWWCEHEKPRDLWKALVMPMIYGQSFLSLNQTLREYVRDDVQDFLLDDGIKVVDVAVQMASAVWETMKIHFPNTRDLSHWLGRIAGLQMKQGQRPHWLTPNRMMVQTYSNTKKRDYLKMWVSGRTIRVQQDDQDKTSFNVGRSKRRMVPDYVQSMDAAFLQRFACHWFDTYGHPLSTVHDCFGTTIANVGTLRAELNDQWARFYSVDHLARHKGAAEVTLGVELPPPPCRGTLERDRIGENPYLFC